MVIGTARSVATDEALEASFLEDVQSGLSASQKRLPCKYFYDAEGSALFERICELDEYYLTRTELRIMHESADEMAALLGAQVLVVEPGSGASVKTRLLLEALEDPVGYVPVDISEAALAGAAPALADDFPELEVLPVVADFTGRFWVPSPRREPRRTLVYFPGSTIGNFEPGEAADFLARLRTVAGAGGAVLIGVDLHKDASVLEPAYDDAAGVTAAFNRNLLVRINRELGGDFKPERFAHVAAYDPVRRRIDMFLESTVEQGVRVGGERYRFAPGERIHTESSYKYTLPEFQRLARRAGLDVERVWTDPNRLFSVQYLRPRS